jgi:DNA helicase-2/ATP-dependent DNA helicase PcrA
MEIVADLHLHSHFSIATGREADLEHLDLWGRYKGVQVVGTGDCTHPEWLNELETKLEPVGPGTYALKPDLGLPLELKGPAWQNLPRVHFLVSGEVSTIYKKAGQVRKVHLLLVLSSLEAARSLSQRLGRLGNVSSDGRPILGLDAKFVLELVLEVDPQALVIPAHIWTPWFSVLGSRSGFDALEECFEEGVARIFALETGLSSDPAMNWRVSALDRFLLLSNSDAHSPQKLGREANLFHVPPFYPDLARAVRTREGFGGTLEFFPQEGKYHLDGHRNCQVRLAPEEAEALGGVCPKCGKPLTYGVMHRVLDLADRPPGYRPPQAKPFESIIGLTEILKEVLEVGSAASKKVRSRYFRLLEKLGPELSILRRTPMAALAREGGPLLAHGIDQMRRGQVELRGGYDGAYGEIRLFTPEQRRQLLGQSAFFSLAAPAPAASQVKPTSKLTPASSAEAVLDLPAENPKPKTPTLFPDDPLLAPLNQAQRQAVLHQGPALLVAAGPGTGKTRALTHRLAYLLARRDAAPEEILAVTFTRQAAQEMAARLGRLLPDIPGLARLAVKTFHALGHQILLEHEGDAREVAVEARRRELLKKVSRPRGLPLAALDKQITALKQALCYPEEAGETLEPRYLEAFRDYEAALRREGLWDYEDLLARPVRLLARRPDLTAAYRQRCRHLLVDEYQDLNEAQYRLFRLLAGPRAEIMVIGDPDQAIYGFRGARPQYFSRFLKDWPDAASLSFTETYRLPAPLLAAAGRLRAPGAAGPRLTHQAGAEPLVLLESASEEAEARAIAREIQKLVGGLTHYALEDAGLRHGGRQDRASFRDVAVLYRLHALGPELERRLTEAGIPCQQAREGVGPEWDGLDLAAERVKLLTLHAAKGLEFPYVFIAGCESGLIPWEPEGDYAADPEEERRLFYVGLTRASRQVFLSRSRERTVWGVRRRTRPSPLIQALPPETLSCPAPAGQGRWQRQPRLFPELRRPRVK